MSALKGYSETGFASVARGAAEMLARSAVCLENAAASSVKPPCVRNAYRDEAAMLLTKVRLLIEAIQEEFHQ